MWVVFFWPTNRSNPQKHVMATLYYGLEKPNLFLLSECQFFVRFQLQTHWTEGLRQMDAEWWYIRAHYGKLCNTLKTLFVKLKAFFFWLKYCLSDLPLTGSLYGTVVSKDVWLNTCLLNYTQYRYFILCVHIDFYNICTWTWKIEWNRAFNPSTSTNCILSSLLCSLEEKWNKSFKVLRRLALLCETCVTPLD